MAFCRNCGQQNSDDAVFCAKCGTPTTADQNAQQATPVQPQVMNGDADAQANKSIAWLSYLGLFFLIPMFAKKDSEYCRYHVKQGATLFCCELAYGIVKSLVIDTILYAILKHSLVGFGIYSAISTILGIASIFFFVVAIIGIINAANGKKNELPLIGKIPFIADLVDKIYASLK